MCKKFFLSDPEKEDIVYLNEVTVILYKRSKDLLTLQQL